MQGAGADLCRVLIEVRANRRRSGVQTRKHPERMNAPGEQADGAFLVNNVDALAGAVIPAE